MRTTPVHMTERFLKVLWVAFLLCPALPLRARQEAGTVPVNPPASDNFVGEWKFNPEKSPNSGGTTSEVIKIEQDGSGYKFTYDWKADNGTELHWWFVTDMKGNCVQATQSNGQPMNGEHCLTRINSDAFMSDNSVLTEQFKVKSKGQILNLERSYKHIFQGRKLSNAKLVFDRVSNSSD
jgi:hypothetical protein